MRARDDRVWLQWTTSFESRHATPTGELAVDTLIIGLPSLGATVLRMALPSGIPTVVLPQTAHLHGLGALHYCATLRNRATVP